MCGYCGKHFRRSRISPSGYGPHATEQDWDDRVRHLQEDHNFRECNSSKKFFRADHFRQHLKRSHAALSGAWIELLDNACLMVEEPSQRPEIGGHDYGCINEE